LIAALEAGRSELEKGRSGVWKASWAQRQRLLEELRVLAQFYVANESEDARLGMEVMCDDFFRVLAERVYPGGWAGLLNYAMKAAG
jgi:hypothetical protein